MSIFVFVACVLIIGFSGMFYLIKRAEKLHKEIDKIVEDVNAATTKKELEATWERLKIVSRKCWHESFENRIIRVKTIIETKYPYLP